MNILVTGAFGYIGNEVIQRLTSNNHNVFANDISAEGALRYYPIWHDKVQYIHDDVCELKCPCEVDIIIHLAAEVGYVSCDDNPEKAIRTNIEGVKNIASFQKPTLFFSTGSVYGKLDGECNEESKCDPQTLYARTKLEGEEIIKSHKIDYCITRPATAYGLSYKTRDDLLIHDLSKIAVKEKKVVLYQPNVLRTFYHVNKIADFVVFCVENWGKFSGETFNLGNSHGNISKIEIIKEIAKYCKFDLEINNDKSDPDHRDYQVNYTKLRKLWDDGDSRIQDHLGDIIKYYSYKCA